MMRARSISPIDTPVIEALAERPDQRVRIRVQPSVFRQPAGTTHATYQAWRNLHWIVEVDSLEEARAFREALSDFFWIAGYTGIGAVRDKLGELVPETPSTAEATRG